MKRAFNNMHKARSGVSGRGLRSRRGSAMIEALIGTVIFAIGVLGIIGMHTKVIKLAADSRYRTEAAVLADELISNMSVYDKAALLADFGASGGGVKTASWVTNRLTKAGSGLPDGKLTLRLTRYDSGSAAGQIGQAYTNGVFLATVTISWSAPGTAGAKTYGSSSTDRLSYTTQSWIF